MVRKILFLSMLFFTVSAHARLDIQAWTLENGARVLFVESHSVPIVDVNVAFDAGSRRDPEGKAGTAALTNELLVNGVGAGQLGEPALSEAKIADMFADIGALHTEETGRDYAGITLRILSSAHERDAAVSLMARMLAQPSFPEKLVTREKARSIAVIKEDLTKPESLAERAFGRILYGNHPYGWQETVASVSAIRRSDIAAFHARHYVANRAVVAIIGDISRPQAETIATELTKRLAQGTELPPLPPVPPSRQQEEIIPHPASQSHILIGAPALARGDQDYFPLLVGNYALGGGGFESRLMQQVREKRGLAYSVYSQFDALAEPGPFRIGLETKRDQTGDALQLVRDVLAAYLRDGPTAEELKAAKDNLIGGFPLRIDDNQKILANIAMIGFYHLPLDYLDTWTDKVGKVTVEEIRSAFGRKVAMDRLGTVIVGGVRP
jgi:zinc protease